MSGTEAAASLFGSEDPSSDPFATLGTEASDNLFAGVTADNSAESAAANLFDGLGEQGSSSTGIENSSHTRPAAQGYGYSPDPYAPTYGASGTPETYETYGTQSQWDGNQAYYGASTTSDFNVFCGGIRCLNSLYRQHIV